jgi:1-acyl-sn-glycerol-3-phosphate acyltransferase
MESSAPDPSTDAVELATAQPPSLTPELLARLTPFERFSFRFVRRLSRGFPKSVMITYLCEVIARIVDLCSWRLMHVEGLESLRIQPTDRILMVSNHRTFFDQFVLNVMLFKHLDLSHHFCFPVRADFFYDRPAGLLLNLVMGGLAMYPPFFRQPEKRDVNRFALDEVASLLGRPGMLVGMHPEGTRNKGPDPYALLPAQPGIGELCYKARPPVVLPAFVLGLDNNLGRLMLSNFRKRGAPIIAVYGAPIDLSAFYARSGRLATYKQIADHLLSAVGALSERERAVRSELERAGAPPLPRE